MIYIIIVAASFLIGFNLSVISGTLVFLQDGILKNPFQEELVVGSLLIGSFIGLICVASFIDWFGRRNSLVISYALFFSGAILFALSETIDGLVVGRLLTGVALGASSVVAPMFLAEISQKDQRGGIVSLHQLLITIYYAPTLLLQEGIASKDIALFASVGIGIVNFIMTIFAIYFIDKLGRKPLLVYGSTGMILGLILSLWGFYEIGTLLYIASFATSLGPVVWVYLAEIYPEKYRGRLLTVATFFNLFFNAVIAFSTLNVIEQIGVNGLYGIFIFFLILGIFFTLRYLPETQGKSLDDIEHMFKKKT
ncbi:MAG: MFS transporter [Chlamydiae bacterium]|nr:MFS transporter [Chlamydiota bacterium]